MGRHKCEAVACLSSQVKCDFMNCYVVHFIYCEFCVILAYGQNLVAVATCLRTLQSEMSSSYCRPRRLPVLTNHIFVVSRINAFIAMLVQKLVVIVTSLCPLCTRVSQTNLPVTQTLSQNKVTDFGANRKLIYNVTKGKQQKSFWV